MFSKNSLLFYTVVFLSNIIQCITGFAGTVLAMPFSLMLVGYDVAKPVLNVLGVAASIGVIASAPKSVNKHEFTKILSVMAVGILVGELIMMFSSVTSGVLYKLLGAMVLLFTVLGCIDEFFTKKSMPMLFKLKRKGDALDETAGLLTLAVAGVVHGMFVCGGPLLVLYADRKLKDKQEFRTTLSAVWVVLNGLILLSDAMNGYFAEGTVAALAACMVVLLAAVAVGNLVARKLNRKAFMAVTYVLMAISGISLFIK